MWKIILLAAACIVIGFVVGSFVGKVNLVSSVDEAVFVTQESLAFKFGQAAKDAYYNEPNQTAVWALKYYIGSINEMIRDRGLENMKPDSFFTGFNQDLIIAHARLGILYRKLGDLKESKFHFDEAMSIVRSTGLEFVKTPEDLEKLVSSWDDNDKISQIWD